MIIKQKLLLQLLFMMGKFHHNQLGITLLHRKLSKGLKFKYVPEMGLNWFLALGDKTLRDLMPVSTLALRGPYFLQNCKIFDIPWSSMNCSMIFVVLKYCQWILTALLCSIKNCDYKLWNWHAYWLMQINSFW